MGLQGLDSRDNMGVFWLRPPPKQGVDGVIWGSDSDHYGLGMILLSCGFGGDLGVWALGCVGGVVGWLKGFSV